MLFKYILFTFIISSIQAITLDDFFDNFVTKDKALAYKTFEKKLKDSESSIDAFFDSFNVKSGQVLLKTTSTGSILNIIKPSRRTETTTSNRLFTSTAPSITRIGDTSNIMKTINATAIFLDFATSKSTFKIETTNDLLTATDTTKKMTSFEIPSTALKLTTPAKFIQTNLNYRITTKALTITSKPSKLTTKSVTSSISLISENSITIAKKISITSTARPIEIAASVSSKYETYRSTNSVKSTAMLSSDLTFKIITTLMFIIFISIIFICLYIILVAKKRTRHIVRVNNLDKLSDKLFNERKLKSLEEDINAVKRVLKFIDRKILDVEENNFKFRQDKSNLFKPILNDLCASTTSVINMTDVSTVITNDNIGNHFILD